MVAISDPPPRVHAPARPSRARYSLVALLPIVAIASVLLWVHAADTAVSASTDKFVPGSVPGEVTLNAHPDTWYIYAETGTTVQSIQVTDPNGLAIPVKSSYAGSYKTGGLQAHAVGQFTLKPGQIGTYRVAVTGTRPFNNGFFTVGNFSVNGFTRPQLLGMVLLLVVNVGSAVAIAVAPIMNRRRRPQLTGEGDDDDRHLVVT
jgi:hypothetical protein